MGRRDAQRRQARRELVRVENGLLKDLPGKKKVHAFFKKNRPGLQVHKTYLNGVATNELVMDPLDVTEADDDDDIDNSFSAARFDGLLVVDDGVCACPVRAPQGRWNRCAV
jgi:hypothetical protein